MGGYPKMALLRSVRILRRVLETWGEFESLNSSEKPLANAGVKNSNNNNNNNYHRIKLKECEKKDKYLDLAKELKKLWNMKMTVIPIVISAFGTGTNGLLNELEDLEVGWKVGTIQTTALLRMARILRRVPETWGDLLSLKLPWKTIIIKTKQKLQITKTGTIKCQKKDIATSWELTKTVGFFTQPFLKKRNKKQKTPYLPPHPRKNRRIEKKWQKKKRKRTKKKNPTKNKNAQTFTSKLYGWVYTPISRLKLTKQEVKILTDTIKLHQKK